MRFRKLSQAEAEYCDLAFNNVCYFLRNFKSMPNIGTIHTVLDGNAIKIMLPPEIYLKTPEVYEKDIYFKRVKEALKADNIELTRKDMNFGNSKPKYLWCIVPISYLKT